MDEEVAQALQGTWSAEGNVRIAAELRLKELQIHGEAGLSLARIAAHTSADLALRQSAALALRRYAKDRWAPLSPTFQGHSPSPQIKDGIRACVLGGLSDPARRIRSACAYTVSEIAHHDWPEEWPSLMPSLLELLNSSQRDATAGAMVVLADLVRTDLTEDQLIPLAQQTLPMLGRILSNPQAYSPYTRARCISVFRQCLSSLFMVKDEYPQAVQKVTGDILPQWLGAFEQLLQVPLASELSVPQSEAWQSLTIRAEIFKTLASVLNGFPKSFASTGTSFIDLALAHLETCSDAYHELYLAEGALPPSDDEEANDLESSLPRLVALIMSFLASALFKATTRRQIYDPANPGEVGRLRTMALASLRYARVTVDDEEKWEADPNSFVVDEDDEAMTFGARSMAEDLLSEMLDQVQRPTVPALLEALGSFIATADSARSGDESSTWWKHHESALMLAGRFATDLAAEGSPFSLKDVFQSLVAPNLTRNDLPFLQGRCFVFSSQWAQTLPPEYAEQIAKYGCEALARSDIAVVVKLSIVRALRNFFRYLPAVASPYASTVFRQLAVLLPQTSDATAILLLETVQAALTTTQDSLDVATLSEIMDLVLAVWRNGSNDPLLIDAVTDLFTTLSASASPAVTQALLQNALPHLAAALAEPPVAESPLAAPAMMLLEGIIRGRPTPLAQGLFATVGESVFAVVEQADDAALIQDGLEVLSLAIRKDPSQVFDWRSTRDGSSGLDHLVKAISHTLHPDRSESGGLFVGDLILNTLRKAGERVGPILSDLLRTLVGRLAIAKTATFSQSMILPFAYLITSQADTVLSLLESWTVETPSGSRGALPVLLESWCDNSDAFQGVWNIRISTVALSQLLMSSRPALSEITVRGERILTAENVNTIMTRSKARANPDQYQAVPFRAKVIKLLVAELQSLDVNEGAVGQDAIAEADDDDGDEDWEDDGNELSSKAQHDLLQLSDMLGADARHILTDDEAADDDEDDEDLEDDPIYQVDVPAHLSSLFRQAYASDAQGFRELSSRWLDGEELAFLQAVLR